MTTNYTHNVFTIKSAPVLTTSFSALSVHKSFNVVLAFINSEDKDLNSQ